MCVLIDVALPALLFQISPLWELFFGRHFRVGARSLGAAVFGWNGGHFGHACYSSFLGNAAGRHEFASIAHKNKILGGTIARCSCFAAGNMVEMAMERDERIKQRAYELWEQDGRPEGKDGEHWARAAEEIDGESRDGARLRNDEESPTASVGAASGLQPSGTTPGGSSPAAGFGSMGTGGGSTAGGSTGNNR